MFFASAAYLACGLIGALSGGVPGQCAGSLSQRGLAQCCGGGSCTRVCGNPLLHVCAVSKQPSTTACGQAAAGARLHQDSRAATS